MEMLFGQYRIHDPLQELDNLHRLNLPIPPEFSKANSFFNPRGESPARGYFLMLRRDLDKLDLNAEHDITLADDFENSLIIQNVHVTKEPQCLTAGTVDDSKACYMVEVADARQLLADPFMGVAINKQYNVPAPAWSSGGTDHYDHSENGGAAWTWTTMIQDVWNLMSTQLGSAPALPITPDGQPENWKFIGVSAWKALCQVLYRIGCTVQWEPETDTYAIVQIGTADSTIDTEVTAADKTIIYNREFQAAYLGRIPGNVRVFFHREYQHYGSEETTAKDAGQWLAVGAYSVDVATAQTGADSSLYHPIWDDLPALYDYTGTIQNAAACSTRATERATDFYRMLGAGGLRSQKWYYGLLSVKPTGTIAGVAHRQDLFGVGAGQPGGLITEIIHHPWAMLGPADGHVASPFDCWCCDNNTKIISPDFRPTYPVYPHLMQRLRTTTGTPDGSGLFTAKLEQLDPTGLTWVDQEDIVGLEINGETALVKNNHRYSCRLMGWHTGTSKPVYTFKADSRIEKVATATIASSQNDYALPAAAILQADVTADSDLTGLTGGVDGLIFEIQNVSSTSKTLTIKNQSASSSAANRFKLPFGYDINLPPQATAAFKYNGVDSRWYALWEQCCGGQLIFGAKTFQVASTVSWSSNQNDYAWGNYTLLEANVTSASDLTGIAGTGLDGQMIEIMNVGSADLTLKDSSASSSAANRIDTYDDTDIIIKPKQTVALKYNLAATKWYILGIGTSTFNGSVTFNGPIIQKRFATTISSNTDNLALGTTNGSWVDATTSGGSYNLTGMTGGSDGRIVEVTNKLGGSGTLTIVHDATSTAANRFYNPDEKNLVLTLGESIICKYSSAVSRWIVLLQQDTIVGCKVYNGSTPQTITATNTAALTFSAQSIDSANMWAVGDPTKVVFTEAGTGVYQFEWTVSVSCAFAVDDAIQTASIQTRLNGTTNIQGGYGAVNLFRSTYRTGDDLGQVVLDFDDGVIHGSQIVNITATTDYIELLGAAGAIADVDFADATLAVYKINRSGKMP